MHLEQYGEPHFNFSFFKTSTRVSITAWKHSSLPTHWDPQPPGKVVHLVSLQTSSQEYQDVLTHFEATGGVRTQINIERVQNPGLYKQYLAKKATMDGGENEKQLFHGTRFANTPSINANNFNRNFAETNGKVTCSLIGKLRLIMKMFKTMPYRNLNCMPCTFHQTAQIVPVVTKCMRTLQVAQQVYILQLDNEPEISM